MPVDEGPTRGPAQTVAPTVPAPSGRPSAPPPPAPPSGGGDGGGGAEPSEPSKRKKPRSLQRTVIEWVLLLGGALVIALLIKTFLFQAFYIPSESMTPTLNVGDRVLVNKVSYRLHDVNRGDIVVFETPPKAEDANGAIKDLVKRVVALPGETLSTQGGRVFINGRPLEEPYLENGTKTCTLNSNPADCERGVAGTEIAPIRIPKDHVYVMGDNRGASKDSRFFDAIEESSIVGRVFIRIWPINDVGFL
jgi:signal peptidase I